MTNLQHYLQDGASQQARATLMFLQGLGNVEESWNTEWKTYDSEIKVARWENCREQGYIVSIKDKKHDQLNIAFFEHRNSDNIHAVKWQQNSMNSLTIGNAIFGEVYKDKYDTSFSTGYGEALKMAEWIFEQLSDFYNK